ncbi:5-demethoxyubiquinol-8 5-hydroxylase UbiM [Neptuniibacter halophilus]|uniref:5-demethoxyubiquinol-8 5-hydroxylase UbiM n=1 Tax=Neptuniibacter halophilus TaxID=651666 RepID=UPI002572E941|nr:5-demethoxyubiquinol-8 5-hydroxylase UbiM [Neptuniibacter halophilus]
MTDTSSHYDILIIGAGPAGLSFARSLAELPLRVGIIERSSAATLADPAEDGREIALTHQSVELMKTSGVWQRLPAEAISPIEAAKVFDGGSSYSLNFDNNQPGLDALGYLVPNHHIRKACYEELCAHPSVELISETAVEQISTDQEWGSVGLNNGQTLHARLIVAADTRFSEMRRKMGLSATMRDFSRSAIVCRMEHSQPHQQTAFECFHYGRTTAILPMNGNRSSIVVTVNSRDAQSYADMSDTEFNQTIEQQLDGLLGEMKLLGKRHVYPLVAVHANQFVSRRFALIGDAAVGMHPVTAHGFNLGLKGQATLAKQIMNAVAEGEDFAGEAILQAYEREQMRTTRVLYHGTNLVVGLFTNESLAAKLARKATLRLANNIQPLKQLITHSLTEQNPDSPSPLEEIRAHLPPLPSAPPLQEARKKIERMIPDRLKPGRFLGLH